MISITREAEGVIPFADDPHLDKGTKAFLKVLNSGGPPVESLSKRDARNVLINLQASARVDLSGIDVSEKTITTEGFAIKLHVVRPEKTGGSLPCFMFIHGGGWILGDFPTHQRMVRDLVVQSGYVAVFVNYTPSPEAHYPQAINEIYAATKWVSEHGNELFVDGKRMAIVGNSVGGNMSTVTTLMIKTRGGPDLRLQVLMWPILDSGFDTESYRLFGKDRFLTTSLIKWMYDQYTKDPQQRKEIYASPLQATSKQLSGLPPALIQVAENDILRDEGEAYGRELDKAGVKVTTVRYNGMIHDFGLLNGLAELPATRSLFVHAAAELKKHLN